MESSLSEVKGLKQKICMATPDNLEDIVELRVQMQIEDWKNTLNRDFSGYSEKFAGITRTHLKEKLGKSIYFVMMYQAQQPIAMCGLEELSELPQITVCEGKDGRHGCIVSVYTVPEQRGQGYQQKLIRYLLDYAKEQGFHDVTLTTNTPDAVHIYEKAGFKHISDKYFLGL